MTRTPCNQFPVKVLLILLQQRSANLECVLLSMRFGQVLEKSHMEITHGSAIWRRAHNQNPFAKVNIRKLEVNTQPVGEETLAVLASCSTLVSVPRAPMRHLNMVVRKVTSPTMHWVLLDTMIKQHSVSMFCLPFHWSKRKSMQELSHPKFVRLRPPHHE